jgi:hypothetical protein
VLLDELGDPELLLEPLALAGLDLLLADELRDPERRCGLRGEVLEKATVVGRVALVREPWSQVQRADQLAVRDERHDELDAGLAQPAKGRGVELQPIDVDGARCLLQHDEQRVALGDGNVRSREGIGHAGRWGRMGRAYRGAVDDAAEDLGEHRHRVGFSHGRVKES